ncbi:MAG: TonB-dependent receptor [Bryobacteraceae bacterium]
MRQRVTICSICFLALLVCLPSLLGQTETSQISGTVMDPTGAVVPNATVTLKSVATGLSREVTTNPSGVYAFPNLPPGEYQISAVAGGFTTVKQQATLTVGGRLGLDFHLEVGRADTVVQVEEVATSVNTETQTIGAVVTTQQIAELPTIARDPYALMATVGNVSNATPDGRGVGYAINGQRASATNVMLDGTANNDEFGATIGQHVPLDSVQEFSVLTNNFTAEYGRASAGIVNVITKSGSNDYHGSAYEFGRYSHLASNSFENNANELPKPVFTRNQFGFSLGGPVLPKLRNKLFFFHNTEWLRVRSTSYSTVYVPTPELISAAAPATQDFFNTFGKLRSGLTDLGTYSKNDFANSGFDPCKGLSATSLCAGLSPTMPLFDRVAYAYPSDSGGGSPQNTYWTVTKIDYNLSDRTQMYWRYARSNEFDFNGSVSNSPYAGYDSPNTQVNNSMVYSLTHTFTPTLISQTKIDFNRFNNQQPFSGHGAVPTLYLGSAAVGTVIMGNSVAMPGYLPYSPGNGIPFGGPQNYVELYQDLSWIHGKHDFRFGGTYTYLRDNRMFGAYETAIEALGNSVPKGMENFLLGDLYQFQAAVYPQGKFPCGSAGATPDCTLSLPVGPPNFSRSNRYNDWALYAQDSWKITPRLTLNYGIRWEIYGTQHNKDPKLDSNFYLGQGSDLIQKIVGGSVQLAPNSPIGKLWATNYGNFAPRLGLAYDLGGEGKTVIRGGYGRGYERNFGNVTFNIIQNPPNYAVLSLFGGSDLPVIPVSVDNAGPLAGSTGSKALGKVSLRAVDPNLKTAYVDFWSLALEHKFKSSVIAALEYNGSRGQNQYGIANVNRSGSAAAYLGAACDGGPYDCLGRMYAYQYSNINWRTNGGFADYQALNMRLEVVNIHQTGLNLRANYTWSHSIDTLSDTFSSSGNQQNLGWLDPFNPALDKGDSLYDLRQRFTMSAIWDIPYRGNSAVGKQVLGGWEVAPIFVANTGAPYSLYDCTYGYEVCPYAMFSGAVPKMNTGHLQSTGNPDEFVLLDVSSKVDSSWYNPKVGLSQFGRYPSNMIGRDFFRSPGSWNMDFGIYKNFTFGERRRLQFRAEAYNLFNHANMYASTGNSDVSSSGGTITSYFDGRRQVQIGLRFIF